MTRSRYPSYRRSRYSKEAHKPQPFKISDKGKKSWQVVGHEIRARTVAVAGGCRIRDGASKATFFCPRWQDPENAGSYQEADEKDVREPERSKKLQVFWTTVGVRVPGGGQILLWGYYKLGLLCLSWCFNLFWIGNAAARVRAGGAII